MTEVLTPLSVAAPSCLFRLLGQLLFQTTRNKATTEYCAFNRTSCTASKTTAAVAFTTVRALQRTKNPTDADKVASHCSGRVVAQGMPSSPFPARQSVVRAAFVCMQDKPAGRNLQRWRSNAYKTCRSILPTLLGRHWCPGRQPSVWSFTFRSSVTVYHGRHDHRDARSFARE